MPQTACFTQSPQKISQFTICTFLSASLPVPLYGYNDPKLSLKGCNTCEAGMGLGKGMREEGEGIRV